MDEKSLFAMAALSLAIGCRMAPGRPQSRDAVPVATAEPRPLVIAHRGASGHRPEHTLEAYALAIAMGADFIEPDLVSTRDGVLVARHENEIGSTTDVATKFPSRRASKVIDGDSVAGWFTEDFMWEELRTLRTRERLPFRSHAYDGLFAVPTFDEVLALADSAGRRRGRMVGVYPETKHPTYFRGIGLPLEDRLLAALRARGLDRRDAPVFIQSFEAGNLRDLRNRTPVRLVQLVFDSSHVTRAALREIATYADAVGVPTRLVVPAHAGTPATSVIRDAHAAGLLVHAWTLRPESQFLAERYAGDPLAEVRELAALGVDGMFGDFPDLMMKGLGRVSSELSAQQESVHATGHEPYPHAAEPIGTVRQIYDGVLSLQMAVNTFRNIDRLFPTRRVPRAPMPMPLPPAAVPLTNVSFSDGGKRHDLGDYLKLNRVAGLLVLQDGLVKLERYRFGNSERTRWMSMSIAKSITSTLIGAAVKQGYISSLSDPVTRYVPSLAGSAYEGASVRDVLMMSSGVRWNETYTDPASDRRRLLEAQISQVSGAALAVMRNLPRSAPPGTVNNYSTGETQVAAEILRSAVGRPLATYLSERMWSKFGMEADANWWLDSTDGIEIGGSGFSATLRDYGRFGLFLLNGGRPAGEAILPADWMREATTPKALRGGTPLAYGYLWWTAPTAASRRDGAFAGEGIHGQFLYVNPAAKVVIVVWSAQPKPTGCAAIDDWQFFDAVTEALR